MVLSLVWEYKYNTKYRILHRKINFFVFFLQKISFCRHFLIIKSSSSKWDWKCFIAKVRKRQGCMCANCKSFPVVTIWEFSVWFEKDCNEEFYCTLNYAIIIKRNQSDSEFVKIYNLKYLGARWVRQYPNKGYLDSLCRIRTQ